ncbi:MAG: long-chain fatty acid--CoA ligase [Desulfatitalea sp.]
MTYSILDGCPSTSGDDFQLNTSTIIRSAARTFPEVEIVSRNVDGTIFRYNYKEAHERTKKVASALIRMGVKPGDRIGVMEWNTYRHFELYFAISGIGAVFLQMNLRLSPSDLSYVVNHSEAKFIFVGDSLLPVLEAAADTFKSVKGYVITTDQDLDKIHTSLRPVMSYEKLLEQETDEFEWPMINEKSAYSACYTSGTTGKPKGVYYSHRCIYLHTLVMSMTMQLCMNDVIMQTVPMFHGQGWGVWFSAPMVGAKLVLPGRYTMDTTNILVDLMVSEKVTFNCGAPAIFMPMLEYIRTLPEKPLFEGLRMVSGATEPPLAMMKGYWDLGKAKIVQAYGATETTPLVLVNTPKPTITRWPIEQQWNNQKKQGLPLAGLDLKIVGHDGKQVPADGVTSGEILVRGPWITTSYYNDQRTEECFEDGYWKSGDAGTIDQYNYVKITDRIKDVIKSGGEWISSIDLENSIMGHKDVLEACVVGLPHPTWQERPVAFVVLRANSRGKVTEQEIKNSVSDQFAKWQLPEVVFVDELPKTSVGKLDKKVVRSKNEHFFSGKSE